MLKISMSGNTDIGLVRRINEDSFLLLPEHNALIVCDGMGGHAAGEVASSRAIDTVAAFLTHDRQAIAEHLQTPSIPSMPPEALELAQSVRLANRSVFMKAQSQKGMRGMGTTLVAARFWNGCVGVCHVGDSRAYRFFEGKLEPWTIDHSLLAELKAQGEITEDQEKHFPERNVITRALGTRPSVAVDVKVDSTRQGEWYVLCSDGLCGYVDDKEIEQTLAAAHPDQEKAVQALIERANQTGGNDNVTVAIAVVDESSSTFTMEPLLETAPEAPPEEAEQEMYLLRELGQSIDAPEESPTDEVNTDRIKIINPPLDSGAENSEPPTNPHQKLNPEEPDEDPKRKRKGGFWPWS
jgi:protein phosphatase